MLALSPRVALAILPLPAGFPLDDLAPAGAAGPLEGAVAMQRLAPELGGQVMLLARQQPGLAAGGPLTLAGETEVLARFRLEPATTLAELLPEPTPAGLQALLEFVLGRALGSFRARDDAELSAACHALAGALPLPEIRPALGCGPALALWQLPRPLGRSQALLATPQRLLARGSRGGEALLLGAEAAGGVLVLPGAATPWRLAPAAATTPKLAELVRKGGAPTPVQRSAMVELAFAAGAEPRAAAQLRAMAALTLAQPPRISADPQRPVGGALELALDDHGGGLFLRAWTRDPLGLVEQVTLESPFGTHALPVELRHAYARPDLAKTFAQAPHGGNGPQPGFVAWLPEAGRVPQAQWTMALHLGTGERLELTSPPGLLPPGPARDAIFTGLPLSALSAPMLDECIVPAVRRIHGAFLAARQPPSMVQIGAPPAAPRVAVVVPLYRNLRFLRFQVTHFARDPAMAGCELIYVLDSPDQAADLEHLLRSLHALTRLPMTLVVQAGNYGFASACNAGVAVARAPRLLMLNSDVVPAARGWLPVLEAALDADAQRFAVGPKLLTEDGSTQHAGLYFLRHGPLDEWFDDHYWKGAPRGFPALNRPREVPGVTGAAMLMDRARFAAAGGFSTDYAIGDYEDSDLCLKLRAAGGTIHYEPRAELYHFERQSISGHAVHDRNIATAYNRRLHEKKWGEAIAALMARPEFAPQAGGAGLMRVLMLSHNHPDLQPGGSELVARTLFRALRDRHGVEGLFLAGVSPPLRQRHLGAMLQAVNGQPDEMLVWLGHFDRFFLHQVDTHGLDALAPLLEMAKPDIIHLHHALLFGVETVDLLRRCAPQAKLVFTAHDYFALCAHEGELLTTDDRLCPGPTLDRCRRCFPGRPGADFVMRDLGLRDTLGMADAILVPSEFARAQYLAAGWPAERFSVMPNGIAHTPPCPAARQRRGQARPIRLLRPHQPDQGRAGGGQGLGGAERLGGGAPADPAWRHRLPARGAGEGVPRGAGGRAGRAPHRALPRRGLPRAGAGGGLGGDAERLVRERAAGADGSGAARPAGDLFGRGRHGGDGARRRGRPARPGERPAGPGRRDAPGGRDAGAVGPAARRAAAAAQRGGDGRGASGAVPDVAGAGRGAEAGAAQAGLRAAGARAAGAYSTGGQCERNAPCPRPTCKFC